MRISVRSSDLIAFILRPLECAVVEAMRTMEMQLGSEHVEEQVEDEEATQKVLPRMQGQVERPNAEPVRPLPPADAPSPKQSVAKTDRPVLRLRPRASAAEPQGRNRNLNKVPDSQPPSPTGTSQQTNAAKNPLHAGSPLVPPVHQQIGPTRAPLQATAAKSSVRAASLTESSVRPEHSAADSPNEVASRRSDREPQNEHDRKPKSNGFRVETSARESSALDAASIERSALALPQELFVERPVSASPAPGSASHPVQTERRQAGLTSKGRREDSELVGTGSSVDSGGSGRVPQAFPSRQAVTKRRRLLLNAIEEPVAANAGQAPAPQEPARPKSAAAMAVARGVARDLAQPLRPVLGDLHNRSAVINSASQGSAPPRTVLQVNVNVGANTSPAAAPGSLANRPLDLEALTEALTEALAEAARREGIEV